MVQQLYSKHIHLCSGLLLVGLSPKAAFLANNIRNVGFLRYWNLSNVPLFLLAIPVILLLFRSALWAFQLISPEKQAVDSKREEQGSSVDTTQGLDLLRRFAVPQVILAILALTNYHVQIITRLSSGYPVWYWWLAAELVDSRAGNARKTRQSILQVVCRWMVMYSIIQGGLFASFLPPA